MEGGEAPVFPVSLAYLRKALPVNSVTAFMAIRLAFGYRRTSRVLSGRRTLLRACHPRFGKSIG